MTTEVLFPNMKEVPQANFGDFGGNPNRKAILNPMMKSIFTFFFLIFFGLFCRGKEKRISFLPQAVPQPLDIFLLLDQSSSMKETDPQNNRIEAARFLIDYLASYWAEEQDHRIGLINFGDLKPPNPEDEIGKLVSLDTAKLNEREKLLNKIKPLDLRYTKFIDAFRNARKGFLEAEKDKARQEAIILLTDGEPDDLRRLSRAAYFQEIINFFNDSLKGCQLCVLGIDRGDKYWSKNEPYWEKIAKYTKRLVSADEKELKEAFWNVISILLEGVAEKWDSIPPAGLRIQLDPYLEVATFTIHKELPDAEVLIFNPKEEKIMEKPPKIIQTLKTPRTEIWKIDEPEAGIWTCKLEKGLGRVEVGITRIPIQPRVIYPKEIHPQGKPFLIWASFLRKDGRPIKEHRAYKLKMWVDLKLPETESFHHLDLLETPQIGLFRAQETVKTEREGEYEIILKMKAHKEIAETVAPIKVVRMPYIEVLKPKYEEVQPWRQNVIVEAVISLGGEIINPTELFIDNPNAIIFYQIIDLDKNEVIKSGHLKYLGGEKEPKFWANAGKIKKSGKYQIALTLRSRQKDGKIYEYSHNPNGTMIYRKMDLIDFVIYQPYLVVLFVIIAFLVWDWQRIGRENGWWGWRIGCPGLTGTLDVVKKVMPKKAEKAPEGVSEEKKETSEQPRETEEEWGEPQGIPLKGRKKRIKELGITLIAKRVKESDESGETKTKTKIFIIFEKSLKKPEEELIPNEEKNIDDKTKIYYYS